MIKLTLAFLLSYFLFIYNQPLLAQVAPVKQWDKTFGGSSIEGIKSVVQTSDGGYILGGVSESGISIEKTQASKGGRDYWIIKTDALGNKQWDKTLGGSDREDLTALAQTLDGGYILGGYSLSDISGDKTQPSKSIGKEDFWVVKLDASGNKIWDKTIGGMNNDKLYSLAQLPDGSYILGGQSNSFISGDKTQDPKGFVDYWIVKLDVNGNKLWDKTIGGSIRDEFYSLDLTSDGGFIIGGFSISDISGDKTEASKGSFDYWVVKLDPAGNVQWDKTLGGNNADWVNQLLQTADGGYIIGGVSDSNVSGDKSQINHGNWDYWVVKLSANGTKQWDKTFGGNAYDWLSSLYQTSDGGYILSGNSDSGMSSDKTQYSKGYDDIWVIKIDANGNKMWDKTIGGSWYDFSTSIIQTTDHGYIIGGESNSSSTGDKTDLTRGLSDFWLVKLGPDLLGIEDELDSKLGIYPNPTSGMFKIDLKKQEVFKILVFNALGQVVLTKNLSKTNKVEHIRLDLSKEAKGIYTIQVFSENQVTTRKVVLQ